MNVTLITIFGVVAMMIAALSAVNGITNSKTLGDRVLHLFNISMAAIGFFFLLTTSLMYNKDVKEPPVKYKPVQGILYQIDTTKN